MLLQLRRAGWSEKSEVPLNRLLHTGDSGATDIFDALSVIVLSGPNSARYPGADVRVLCKVADKVCSEAAQIDYGLAPCTLTVRCEGESPHMSTIID